MTDTAPIPPAEVIHVFRVALSAAEASRMISTPELLQSALGGGIDPERAEVIDPTDLAGVGLSGYLIEGLGAQAEPVGKDAGRLDAVTDPVLILRPGGAESGLEAREPLSHLGSYPTEATRPATGTLSSASAEGLVTGTPPAQSSRGRTSGMVAGVTLAILFLIVVVVVLVAS